MIIDNFKNREYYYSLGEGFKAGFSFIEKYLENPMEIGKYEIDGKNVYAMVQEYDSKDEGRFEGHENYADIQFILCGSETMEWIERTKAEAKDGYNPEKDIEFFDAKGAVVMPYYENDFAIFFPGDIHKPGMKLDKNMKIRKIVVKVKLK